MAALKIKVCGMREPENIREIAALGPDYMGFIFVATSPRFVGAALKAADLQTLAPSIRRVGVFAEAAIDEIARRVDEFALHAVQLHGVEDGAYCRTLRRRLGDVEIIKSFLIDDDFDFSSVVEYSTCVDFLLFDSVSPQRGGSGARFDWSILSRYRGSTPFLLAGGVGIDAVAEIRELLASDLPFFGVDLNSRVEKAPGIKSSALVREVLDAIRS